MWSSALPAGSRLVHVLLAATMAAPPLLVLADSDEWRLYYGIMVLALTGLCAVFLMGHFRLDTMMRSAGLFLLIAVPPELSLLVNEYDEPRLAKILAVVGLYAIIGPLALHRPPDRTYPSLFGLTTLFLVITTLLVLGISANSPEIGVILSDRRSSFDLEQMGLHPNYGGLLATAIAVSACGQASLRWRGAILFFCIFVCWLMESRGGLLGMGFAFAVGHACRSFLTKAAKGKAARLSAWGGAACGVAVLLSIVYGAQIAAFISEDFLLLDDRSRGLDSGFSGRTEVWQEAWEQWRSHPVFGLGFLRDLEQGGVEDLNRAHNLALTLLSETGLLGLLGFLGFSVWGAVNGLRLSRRGQAAAASTIISAVTVYWVYGIFEGLSINVGNPLSAIFFLVVFASAAGEAES
ncbi:conserved membrane hypothetical protein [Candidatus Terasakiella magnetica]|nr:conserved membrane hypothetical protein [Candidatus Terasakiella magnetica]